MKRKKKKAPKQRNPVVREMVRNPNRSAGRHKAKKQTKRDDRRLEE